MVQTRKRHEFYDENEILPNSLLLFYFFRYEDTIMISMEVNFKNEFYL